MSENKIIIGEYMQCAGCPAVLGTYEKPETCIVCNAKFCGKCKIECDNIFYVHITSWKHIIYCRKCKSPNCSICGKEEIEHKKCSGCDAFCCYDCCDDGGDFCCDDCDGYSCGNHN